MERFIDHCCDECHHTNKVPCTRFVECRLEGPLCHESVSCRDAREAIIVRYSHSPAFREQ